MAGLLDPLPKPDAPQTKPAAEKNPWSAWAWLGLCRTREQNASTVARAFRPEVFPNIVHVDVDAFFASVEQVLNPKLRGKPVLVGRGCVASASYEAKFLGVKTAMGFREALRVCPQAIVVPGQYEHYADFAERVRRILETYRPAVETAALDDFYLDFAGTARLYPDYEATLRLLSSRPGAQPCFSRQVRRGTQALPSRPANSASTETCDSSRSRKPLPHGAGHCLERTGWFTRNHPSVAPSMCSAI